MSDISPCSPAVSNPGAPVPPSPSPEVRPKTLWYWVSGALALASVLIFGLAVFFANNPVRATPEIVAEIEPPEAVELAVGEGEEEAYAVYSTPGGEATDCEAFSPSGEQHWLIMGGGDRHVDESHGEWVFLGLLETPEPGTYEVHCSGIGHFTEVREGVDYVVGSAGVIHAVDAQRNVVPLTAIGAALVGLLTAVVVAVVTAVRRGLAKKRALSAGAMTRSPQRL